MPQDHYRDEHCTLDEFDSCLECGVYHGDPCSRCGGRGFHREHCPEFDVTFGPTLTDYNERMEERRQMGLSNV